MKKEYVKFIIVGGINTVHYYGWYVLLYSVCHFGYLASHIIATGISMIGSYFLNVYFTYREKPSWKSFLLFPLTQLTNSVIQLICLILFVHTLHMSAYIAPLLTAVVSVPITFIVTRRVIRVSKTA